MTETTIPGGDAKWRSLLELGGDLFKEKNIYRQIEIIHSYFTKNMACKLSMFLLEDFQPLPHILGNREYPPQDIVDFISQERINGIPPITSAKPTETVKIPLGEVSNSIGYLQMGFDQPLSLSEAELDFLQKAGKYLAHILDLVRLSQLKEWRIEQLSLVRQVSNEIIQLRNEEELLLRVTSLIQETFKFFYVALYSVDLKSRKIHFRASSGKELSSDDINELTHSSGIEFGEGLIGACVEKNEQILSPDVSMDERYRNVSGLTETQSEICLPLTIGNEVLGVLEILSDKVARFHDNDILVLKILADSVALAFQNAGLFDNLLEQTWATTLMLQVAEAAQRLENIDDLLNTVVRVATILTGVQKCAIYLRDQRTSDYILNAHYGFNQEETAQLAMLPFTPETFTAFQSASNKETLEMLEICLNKKPSNKKKSYAVIPVIAHGNEMGMLLVDDSKNSINSDSDNNSRGDALMAVSRQTALAIENLRGKESQENEAYINTILLQVAEMVAASKDLDETIENIISLLPLVVGVDTAFIYILDPSQKRMFLNARLSHQNKSQLNHLHSSVKFSEHNKLGQILSNRTPCFFDPMDVPIEDWIQELVIKCKSIDDVKTHNDALLMVFPLYASDDEYGLLFTLESDAGIEYREKKIEIIEGIAKHISLAVQNERLKKEMIDRERIQKELQLAQDIQRTFLPEELPQIPGWKIASRWQPAKQVGGDFYDAFQIEGERLGIVIADVSDKGLAASLYMTVAQTLIHAEGRSGSDPMTTLQKVNEIIVQNSREGLFVTCFYAVIHLQTGEMVYANAGHNRPLWYSRSERKLNWLLKGGMPLGVEPNQHFSNESIQLNRGDQIFLYTDGLVEAQRVNGDLFGEKRLFSTVDRLKEKPINEIVDNLELNIHDFRGNAEPSDDLTILVVEQSV